MVLGGSVLCFVENGGRSGVRAIPTLATEIGPKHYQCGFLLLRLAVVVFLVSHIILQLVNIFETSQEWWRRLFSWSGGRFTPYGHCCDLCLFWASLVVNCCSSLKQYNWSLSLAFSNSRKLSTKTSSNCRVWVFFLISEKSLDDSPVEELTPRKNAPDVGGQTIILLPLRTPPPPPTRTQLSTHCHGHSRSHHHQAPGTNVHVVVAQRAPWWGHAT